jgi:undecaprenyl-diphosphatase
MLLYHIVILAIVQGITEFLPISSSGHLLLTHAILNPGEARDFWGDALTIDIAVHIGTLMAVLLYFRRDVFGMAGAGFTILKTRKVETVEGRMLVYIVIASVPIMIAGYIIHTLEPSWARSLEVIGWTMVGFGILLGVADKYGTSERATSDMKLKDAILIGVAQALALIPGTSRSGITMTAARFAGFTRVEAARFSFLLSIVATSAAGMVGILDFLEDPQPGLITSIIVVIVVSFLAASGAIHFLMRWLARASFTIFVWYRVALGLALLGFLYSGMLA